jgi:polar amino acid transport system substrate-binding protein
VQNGTIEQTDLNTANDACKKAGKPAMEITALTNQTDVIQLLASGRVVATYQDSPVTDYYNHQHAGQFAVGGSVVNAGLEGIVVRKGDPSMFNAIQTAFNQLMANGTIYCPHSKMGINQRSDHLDWP